MDIGHSTDEAELRLNMIIGAVERDTGQKLNAQESVKSIKMEPEQRAFYEGKFLDSGDVIEEDVGEKFNKLA